MGCAASQAVTPIEIPPLERSHLDVERVIGQGGFGKVNAVVKKRGYDRGTWYAMKTLSKAVVVERNHVAMVMKERNLLARLHCPQLVNMHYAFQDARNLFIVMDLCLGGDLHYQLSQQPERSFPEEQARFYAASIVLCLEYMHSAGILHRDIKPENLLLDGRGQLKVTDLGVSAEIPEGFCTSTSGTRPYMAPEIFMSGHRHSFAADFYSLGVTTYQMLAGHRPYKPDAANMKSIVRMSTFIPPDKYTDVAHIRRILVSAQERKAPTPEFRYSVRLAHRASAEAISFIQQCLICNPRYRLGCQGVAEVKAHPWFNGLDWDAMAQGLVPAPFLPDIRRANCAVNEADLSQMLSEDDADGGGGPVIPPAEQAKFAGYDYRTRVNDGTSGRTERVPVRSPSLHIDQTSGSHNATVTGFGPSDATSVGSGSTTNYASTRYGRVSGLSGDAGGSGDSPSLGYGGSQPLRGGGVASSSALSAQAPEAKSASLGFPGVSAEQQASSSVIFPPRPTLSGSVVVDSSRRVQLDSPPETPSVSRTGRRVAGGSAIEVRPASAGRVSQRRMAGDAPAPLPTIYLGLQEFPASRGTSGGSALEAGGGVHVSAALARETSVVLGGELGPAALPALLSGGRRSEGSNLRPPRSRSGSGSESSLRCADADAAASHA